MKKALFPVLLALCLLSTACGTVSTVEETVSAPETPAVSQMTQPSKTEDPVKNDYSSEAEISISDTAPVSESKETVFSEKVEITESKEEPIPATADIALINESKGSSTPEKTETAEQKEEPGPATTEVTATRENTPIGPSVSPVSEMPQVTPPSAPEPAPTPTSTEEYCTISVDCSSALPHVESCHLSIPDTGVMIDAASVAIVSGTTTVYDVLVNVCQSNDIALGGNSGYVSSIGGLAEKACPGVSGWMYSVNGTIPMMPCGGYKLQDGDVVQWFYTCD